MDTDVMPSGWQEKGVQKVAATQAGKDGPRSFGCSDGLASIRYATICLRVQLGDELCLIRREQMRLEASAVGSVCR